jgi:ABC-2 type transport system ATP-binding protein
MSVIEFQNLHRAYKRGQDVLKGVTFHLEPGEVVGLVGKNGSGKTTLMRLALGTLVPQKGYVRLFGIDPRANPVEVKRRIGYVAEDQILPEFLRVGEILRLHQKVFPDWDTDLESRLMERFEVPRRTKIKELSKGQARQIALVCAMAHRPEVLLLDEPAGGLDPAIRREFLETAIQYLSECGSTILFSSHYMGDVERLAGRIVMLHDGKVLLDNHLEELQEEFTLALVPLSHGIDREALLSLEACLAVRKRNQALHAVFHLESDLVNDQFMKRFGIKDIACHHLPLEEMFIEIVGGRN